MLSSDLRFNLRTNLKKSSLKKKLFKTCTKSSLFRACKVWKKVALFSKACEIKYRACVHRLSSIYDTLVTFSHTCNFCMHFFNKEIPKRRSFCNMWYTYEKVDIRRTVSNPRTRVELARPTSQPSSNGRCYVLSYITKYYSVLFYSNISEEY